MKKHNARIARSGVQYYLDTELPGLMLDSIPREYYGWKVFGVYRPSYILENMAQKFNDVPVRVGHQWVDSLSDPCIIGKVTGDVKINHLKDEVVLCAPLEIEDDSDLPKFDELSPGYVSKNIWKKGKAPNGQDFQILCTGIESVNHLAIVEEARGGEDMKILDGGLKMAKVHSGLIHTLRQKIFGVKDGNDKNSFNGVIDTVKNNIAKLTSDELEEHSKKLIAMCDALPDSQEKDKLKRYIADIPLLKAEDARVADAALTLIKESYGTLDSDAVAEIMRKEVEEEVDEKKEKEEKPADKGAEDNQPDPAKKDDKDDKGKDKGAEDGDPMKKICDALDELKKEVQALKGAKDEQPNPNKKDGDNPKVNDGLPLYTQSLAAVEKGYELEEEFNKLKRGI